MIHARLRSRFSPGLWTRCICSATFVAYREEREAVSGKAMISGNTLSRRSFVAGAILLSLEPCTGAFAAGSQGLLARMPFELLANAVFLPLRVNGRGPYLFSLDTGSSNSVIASEVTHELELVAGQTFSSSGAGSDSNMATHIGPVHFGLPGGVERSVTDGALISMSGLWPLIGKRFYGEVGFDVFGSLVVEIDYERRILSLYDPDRFRYRGAAPKLPARFYGAYDPQVEGELMTPGRAPIPVRFTLDTGAGGTIVSSPIVAKNQLLQAVGRTIKAQDRGVGGAMPSEVSAQLSALRIGPFTLQRPIVALSLDKAGSLSNEAISVNLGGNILRRFKVIIDYVNRWVILEPNRSFAQPFRSDASGLLIEAKGHNFRTFVVDGVVPGSPANDAKIARGDEIVSINGRHAAPFALWELEDQLKTVGSTVTIGVRHNGRVVPKALHLRSLI
jgi:hypothetical protein